MTKKKLAGILICIAIALLLLLLMQKHSSDSAKQPADKGSYSYYYAEPDAANAESTTEADDAIPFYQNVK
ncbi:MAG: hypothetical protein ACLT2C_05570 [Ruminococcus sp.]